MQYVWEFILDGKERKIELQHSRITGKRRIYFDGKEILKAQKFTYEFSYSFSVDTHYLSIIQTSQTTYDLRIDNLGYNSILNELKKNQKTEKRKREGKEIIKSILDEDDDIFEKKKENYLNFQVERTKPKEENKDKDDDFFQIQKKDQKSNVFDADGFDFDENEGKNNSNNKNNQNEDIFGLGFA